MLSARYKDAMLFAARLHENQTRKGTEVAYLTHLMSVSALVMENGGDEDDGIAALLHDALEDQSEGYESEYLVEPLKGRQALKRDIELRFGPRVLAVVVGCTDDEGYEKPPKNERGSVADWRQRKVAYIEHLECTANTSLLRVSCADKLHNARTILLDLHELGEVLWSRFRSGNRENTLWYYQSLASSFRAKANAIGDRGLMRLSAELDRTIGMIERHSA